MTSAALTVRRLSKAYRLGRRREMPDTLVGALGSLAKRPWANFRHLRGMDTASRRGDGEDVLWALRDVSFEVSPGEVVGIVGRNGAGKSTLLKILSRITEPNSGEADIHGRVSSLLEVGTGFHPELTGRENIYMNGTILGMSKREIDRKFDEIVDFSGVARFLDTPIKRYSSGMQVRLAFAVAANLEPEILIIDEVLAVGDVAFQRKCLGKMRNVATSGRTVLFVSHNMSAIHQLCTSGLLISNGRVAARGGLDKVVQRYMTELFRTHCEVGNDEIRLAVEARVEGNEAGDVWNFGTTLVVDVRVSSREPIARPAVDLQFYSETGKIAAARSDRFVHDGPAGESARWHFQFRLDNSGIASSYVTVDVGFRFSSSTRYLGHWRSLAAVPVGPIPSTYATGRGCPMALPCAVQLQEHV